MPRVPALLTVVAVIALNAVPAPALMVAVKPPASRALTADIVVIGKVTAIEKEPVEAVPFPGAPNKVAYKLAVVKVETSLAGANNVTHIKVGFIPPPPPAPAPQPAPGGLVVGGPRRPNLSPELKEGQEFVFFLVKHPSGNFLTMPPMSPPLDVKTDDGKKEIENIKKTMAVLEDPIKALKSGKSEERSFAASVMIGKHRSYPEQGGEADQVAIDKDESKLILKGLLESDWTKLDRSVPNAIQSFYSLQLTEKDGWVPPKPVRAQPGQPAANYNEAVKDVFTKWLDGPGKDYVIKKYVLKKK